MFRQCLSMWYFLFIILLKWYYRACGSYYNFFDQGLLLTRKLLNQGFLVVRLKSSRKKKCSSRYHDLFYEYQVCLCFYDISIRFWTSSDIVVFLCFLILFIYFRFCLHIQLYIIYLFTNTVKSVLIGHIWDEEKVVF